MEKIELYQRRAFMGKQLKENKLKWCRVVEENENE